MVTYVSNCYFLASPRYILAPSYTHCAPLDIPVAKGLVINYREGDLQNRRGASEVLPL